MSRENDNREDLSLWTRDELRQRIAELEEALRVAQDQVQRLVDDVEILDDTLQVADFRAEQAEQRLREIDPDYPCREPGCMRVGDHNEHISRGGRLWKTDPRKADR